MNSFAAMKNMNRKLIILIGILTVVALAIVYGIFIYNRQHSPDSANELSDLNNQFISNIQNFSINYPKTWTVTDQIPINELPDFHIVHFNNSNNNFSVDIVKYKYNEDITHQGAVFKDFQDVAKSLESVGKYYSINDISINNYKGKEYIRPQGCGDDPSTPSCQAKHIMQDIIELDAGNNYFEFAFQGSKDNGFDQESVILKNMINTLKVN